jgi:hypothetical protein
MSTPEDPPSGRDAHLEARASDSARIYRAARDQYLAQRDWITSWLWNVSDPNLAVPLHRLPQDGRKPLQLGRLVFSPDGVSSPGWTARISG